MLGMLIISGDLASCHAVRDLPVFLVFLVFLESSRPTAISPGQPSSRQLQPKKFFIFFENTGNIFPVYGNKIIKEALFQEAIMNGISNSATEGLNSKIEVIKRSACGYRNKVNFRTALLFHCGKLDLMPEMER